ncbi:MAG: hypothetical protein ACFB20_09490 [Opitutales bacterium]
MRRTVHLWKIFSVALACAGLLAGCGPSTVVQEGGVRIFVENEGRTVRIYQDSQTEAIRRELKTLASRLEIIRSERRRLRAPEPGDPSARYIQYAETLETIRTRRAEVIDRWERFLGSLQPVDEITTIEFGYFTVELPVNARYVALVLNDGYDVPDRLGALYAFPADGETYIQLGDFALITAPKAEE